MKEEELSNRMNQLSEILSHNFPILGDRQLTCDGHIKKCGEFFAKKMKSWRVEL